MKPTQKGYKTLLLLLLFTTLIPDSHSQLPFEEKILYNQSLKAKKNSLYSFDIDSAFKINVEKDPKELLVSTNWGKITIEGKKDSLTLPESYKASTILLTETLNGFLNIVGFNKLEKKCLISLFYNENISRHLSFDSLSRRECSRVRVSRYGNGTTQRLITYLEDSKGALKWISRVDENDNNTEWKLVDIDLYTEKISKEEFHEVKMITPEDIHRDMFVVYQKSKAPSQKALYKNFVYCYSDAKFGSTNSTSTIKCLDSSVDFYDITESYPDFLFLNWINFESGFVEKKSPGVFIHYDYIKPFGTDDRHSYNFKILNSRKLFYRDSSSISKSGVQDMYGPEYTGIINYPERTILYYYHFRRNTNLLRICHSKYNFLEEIKYQTDFEYNCVSEYGPGNKLASDEFIEKMTTTAKLATVLDVRLTGSLENRRQIFNDFLKNKIYKIDLDENYYSASDLYLFEIKKNFSLNDDLKILIKIGEYKDVIFYMMPGDETQPKNVEIKISTKDNKSLTHKFDLDFVENFESEYVSEREIYIGVGKEEKGRVITGDDIIKVRADFIETGGDEGEFLSLTPFKLISSEENLKKKYEVKLEQKPADEPKPSSLEQVCAMNNFVLFKDENGKIAYYLKKNSKVENEKYMIFKLKPKGVVFDQYKCFGIEGVDLLVAKDTSKNTFTAIIFKENGEYLTRIFYSEYDFFNITTVFFNEGFDLFRLRFEDGKEGYLNFRGMYTYYRLNGVGGGNRSFNGLSGEFVYHVNYLSSGDKKLKNVILE